MHLFSSHLRYSLKISKNLCHIHDWSWPSCQVLLKNITKIMSNYCWLLYILKILCRMNFDDMYIYNMAKYYWLDIHPSYILYNNILGLSENMVPKMSMVYHLQPHPYVHEIILVNPIIEHPIKKKKQLLYFVWSPPWHL